MISAITKSGGNEFHGDVHYYLLRQQAERRPASAPVCWIPVTRPPGVSSGQEAEERHARDRLLARRLFIKNKLFFFSAASPRSAIAERLYVLNGGDRDTIEVDQTYWHMLFNKVSFDSDQQPARQCLTGSGRPPSRMARFPRYNGESANTDLRRVAANQHPTTSRASSQPQIELQRPGRL